MELAGHQTFTVLVADRDDARRHAIRDGLEEAGLHVVAEAATGEEALELALETRPAVCLLGAQLRGQSGLAVAAVVVRVLDGTSVILMTAEPTVGDVLDAVKVGAAGCLSSGLDPDRLAAAVSAVAAGEASFPRRELRQALDFLVPQIAKPLRSAADTSAAPATVTAAAGTVEATKGVGRDRNRHRCACRLVPALAPDRHRRRAVAEHRDAGRVRPPAGCLRPRGAALAPQRAQLTGPFALRCVGRLPRQRPLKRATTKGPVTPADRWVCEMPLP